MRLERKIFTKNAEYQKFEVLKSNRVKRAHYHEFFVEGVRNINEAVKNGWEINSFLYSRETRLSSWAETMLRDVKTHVNYLLPSSLMKELSGKEDTSELLAVVGMRDDDPSLIRLPSNPLLALFDRPSNHGNLGTIIRSCDGMGVDLLIITGHAVDLYDPAVVVSSMGSFFNVPVIRMPDNDGVDQLIGRLKRDYPCFLTVGTTSHRQKKLDEIDLTGPLLLMIGNETEGLCRHFKETCDILGTIPMAERSSASSFNVACASSILFYEAVRQRASRQRHAAAFRAE